MRNIVDVSYEDESGPFEQYLLVHMDNGQYVQAMQILDSDTLDLKEHLNNYLQQRYSGCTVEDLEIYQQNGGSDYAAIITDNNPPASTSVWSNCDFYFDVV